MLSNASLQNFNIKKQIRSNLAHLNQRKLIWALLTMFTAKQMNSGPICTANGTLTSTMVQEYHMKLQLIFATTKSS